MESSQLVSWQFENFSTAELSPPTSPASPSLFYNDGSNPSSPSGSFKGVSNGTMVTQQSQKPVLSSVLSSRAQTASNMLNELERLHSFEHQSVFGNTNEESVDLNMNLFEELADIEYTPPLLSSQEDSFKAFEVPSVPVSPSVVVNPSNDKLSAEFKSIVESLTTTSNNASSVNPATIKNQVVTSFDDLIQITGIPTTTVVGDECLVPVEFIGRKISGGDLGPEEAESMDLDGIIISNDMALVNESELFSLEEISAELIAEECGSLGADDKSMLVNGVLPYWAKDMTIPLDDLDTEMNRNDETLNALLQGDMSTAKTFALPSPIYTKQAFSPISTASEDMEDCTSELEEAEVIEVVEKPAPKKSERRGRKPAKKIPLVKDKALRKKEQNKTAATRYRQKKKQELAVTLAEEDELQTVHDELEKEKQKVGAELKMVRSLLRDMLKARKQRSSSSSASTRPTASSIYQAQKIANRRK